MNWRRLRAETAEKKTKAQERGGAKTDIVVCDGQHDHEWTPRL
jgi:hypothetical protein